MVLVSNSCEQTSLETRAHLGIKLFLSSSVWLAQSQGFISMRRFTGGFKQDLHNLHTPALTRNGNSNHKDQRHV